jgi:hypothetical protein
MKHHKLLSILRELHYAGTGLASFLGDEADILNWQRDEFDEFNKDPIEKLNTTYYTLLKIWRKSHEWQYVSSRRIDESIERINATTLNIEIARFIKSPYFGTKYVKKYDRLCERYLDIIERLSIIYPPIKASMLSQRCKSFVNDYLNDKTVYFKCDDPQRLKETDIYNSFFAFP